MTLGDDLLKGAKRIAACLNLGEREIYVLASRGELPVFKLGKHLCCRKSELDEWLRHGPRQVDTRNLDVGREPRFIETKRESTTSSKSKQRERPT